MLVHGFVNTYPQDSDLSSAMRYPSLEQHTIMISILRKTFLMIPLSKQLTFHFYMH